MAHRGEAEIFPGSLTKIGPWMSRKSTIFRTLKEIPKIDKK
jgi:hypothetical protein